MAGWPSAVPSTRQWPSPGSGWADERLERGGRRVAGRGLAVRLVRGRPHWAGRRPGQRERRLATRLGRRVGHPFAERDHRPEVMVAGPFGHPLGEAARRPAWSARARRKKPARYRTPMRRPARSGTTGGCGAGRRCGRPGQPGQWPRGVGGAPGRPGPPLPGSGPRQDGSGSATPVSGSRRDDAGLGTHVLPPTGLNAERSPQPEASAAVPVAGPAGAPCRVPGSPRSDPQLSRGGGTQTTGVLGKHEDCVKAASSNRDPVGRHHRAGSGLYPIGWIRGKFPGREPRARRIRRAASRSSRASARYCARWTARTRVSAWPSWPTGSGCPGPPCTAS